MDFRTTEYKNLKCLWGAVIEQAIKDLHQDEHKNASSTYNYSKAVSDDAYNWLKSDNDDIASFVWICRELSLNADDIRGALGI